MEIKGKIWGKTQELFFKNNVEIHRIEAKKGGYCSKHYHQIKHNMFFIESGKMKIRRWKNDYDLVDDTTLKAGEMTSVPPGEYHLFEAIEDTVAYEIYWTEVNRKDIVRANVGGNKE